MERINKREFIIHTSKYVKPGTFILTNRGADEYVVSISEPNVATKPNELVNVATSASALSINQYGCGCERVDGQSICKKHQRY